MIKRLSAYSATFALIIQMNIIEQGTISDKILKMTGHIIDAMERGSNARYINHSVHPNA